MKNIKKFILISILIIILAYVTNITAMPNMVVLFKGENINLNTIFGLQIDFGAVPVGTVSLKEEPLSTSRRKHSG